MARKQMSRDEAVQYLTMQRDLLADAMAAIPDKTYIARVVKTIEETGDTIGYAPAFRCLVKGLSPEESIKWGK